MQGWNASIVLEQWTAEEVKEHQAAASNINKEQEQARGEIASARETLEGVHITLHCITSSWRGPNTRKISSEDNFTCMNSATAMTDRPKSRSRRQPELPRRRAFSAPVGSIQTEGEHQQYGICARASERR